MIIAGPMALWMAGVSPAVMLVIHISSLILTARLYSLASSLSKRGPSIFILGGASGVIGSAVGELLLHIPGQANLATAFAAYASLGSMLYRLEFTTTWWPYLFIGINGLFYAGLALLVTHLVRYRQAILGIPSSQKR